MQTLHCGAGSQSALAKTWTGSNSSCPAKTPLCQRAGWTLHDYLGGVRPQVQSPHPPCGPWSRAWRRAVLAEHIKDEQKQLAPVWQKLRQLRKERQTLVRHSLSLAQPQPQPPRIPVSDPFEALSAASDQSPDLQEKQEPFQAPRSTRRQRSPTSAYPDSQPVGSAIQALRECACSGSTEQDRDSSPPTGGTALTV